MRTTTLPTRNEIMKVLEQFNHPVVIVDTDDHIQWANKKFLALYDIKIADIEKLRENSPISILKSGEYILEEDDKKSIFKVERSSIKLQGETLSMFSLYNVTKPKKHQIELLTKMNIFKQLNEYLPEGIVLFNDHIIYSNPAFEKLTGYSGTELLTKKFDELIERSDRKLFNDNIEKLITIGKVQVRSEVRLVGKRGNSFWTRIKTGLLIDGNKHFYLNLVTNIVHERAKIDELNRLAYFDALTGIFNRRKFNELLLHEYNRAKRYHRSLCGIFFDIDHFKQVNDIYGHDTGDVVLQDLANKVRPHIRETDIFARWGGEEFILLLPETTSESALIMAEHIRNSIASCNFPNVGKVTISIGITMLSGKEHLGTFLKRLDKALYKAKKEGRNRSVVI